MHVQLNGQSILLLHAQSLAVFLKDRFIDEHSPGIAVAVNGQIVFRQDWISTTIKEGDEIELVHAVSGG